MTNSEKNTHQSKPFRLSIRITVVGMFLLMTTLTVAIAIGLQYHFSKSMAQESTLASYRQAAYNSSDHLNTMDRRAIDVTRALASNPQLVKDGQITATTRQLFAQTLRDNPLFYAIYIGFADGDFYELINLNTSSAVRDQLQALPQDRWVIVVVNGEGDERIREFLYYDTDFNLRTRRSDPSDYYAYNRPWYVQTNTSQVHKTAPYLFQHLQAPGQTYSMRINGSEAVLAVDIALSSLSDMLTVQLLGEGSQAYLYQASGDLIASSNTRRPALALPKAERLQLSDEQRLTVEKAPVLAVSNELDWPPFDFAIAGEPQGHAIDTLELVSQMTGLRFRYINGYSWPELVAMYRTGQIDILHPVMKTAQNMALGKLSDAFVDAPLGVLTRASEGAINELRELQGKRVAIPAGWSSIAPIREAYPSITIVEVNGVRGMFDAVHNGEVDAGIDMAAILNYTRRQYFLNDVSIHVPLEVGEAALPSGLHYLVQPHHQELVEIINLALANITPEQSRGLDNRWLLTPGDQPVQQSTVPYPELIHMISTPSRFDQLQKMELNGRKHFVYVQAIGDDSRPNDYFAMLTPVDTVLAPAVKRVNMVLIFTGACLLLLLPLSSWLAGFIVVPVKHLAQENDKIQQRRYRELVPIFSRIVEIDNLSSSMMKMAHSIEQHAKQQEALMESFIQLIAQAIDDKSPYTAGHCARVPELAIMLAKHAEQDQHPAFKAFRFDSEQAWREFRIGAWLHDCGKITTPEHIVDKATKLETIYNRIHEIRMRFEVLWRDAEIRYWQKRESKPENEIKYREELEQFQRQLQDDYAFIARCNIGGEFMDKEDLARLETMTQYTWQRHFDDRLGLSPIELARHPETPVSLPCTEKLIDDKPWHIIPRVNHTQHDKHLGINMEIPEHLYNLGEVYNLSIERGTLTSEDRFKINEHMISTIKMLDKLPLTDDLAKVPRYASTHHETLDGRGYPRKLHGEDLSIPERIMVLSDIFEALTAADRPYKPAKPVSVAIDILYRMVQENHVDRDVFELFLRSGTYLTYAQHYLPAEQIDEVDIEQYLMKG